MHLMEKPLSIKCRAPEDLHRRVSRCSIKMHSNSITQNTKCTTPKSLKARLHKVHPCYYAAVLHIWPNKLLLAKKNICADITFILKTQKLMRLVEIVPTDNFQISYFARFRTNTKMNGSACPYWEGGAHWSLQRLCETGHSVRIVNYDRSFFWDTLNDAIFMHNDNVSYENEVKTCFIFTKIVSIGNNYDGVTDDDEKEGRWTFFVYWVGMAFRWKKL